MEDRIFGFEPVFESNARVLILGSMPSVESLRQSFYYAHPRNAFWPILAQVLNENLPLTIEDKKAMLIRHKIALWDTVGSCIRPGSLDSSIRDPKSNNFAMLYKNCPDIRHVFFNGAASHQFYQRLVSKDGQERPRQLVYRIGLFLV